MNYLYSISNTQQEQPTKPSSFSLMKMFKKPAPTPSITSPPDELKQKQEHPYIQNFKRLDEEKRREMEEKMKEAKMTPEERRLKQKLAKDKKEFIRIDDGRESKFQAGKKDGFAKVIDVSFAGVSEKDKEKERIKEKERQRELEREREREKLKELQRQVQKIKSKQEQTKHQSETKPESSALKQKQRERQREKPRVKESQVLKKAKKEHYSRPAQPPPPSKKFKKHNYYSDEEGSMDSFLDSDEDDNIGLEAARKMYGKYYDDKYIKRDKDVIRESTFDEVAREEKVSKAFALKDEMDDLEQQQRRKEEKKRRMKERERQERR